METQQEGTLELIELNFQFWIRVLRLRELGQCLVSHSRSAQSWHQDEEEEEVTQSCLTLCDPTDCSLPGSSVNGVLQARTLKWVAISFSNA